MILFSESLENQNLFSLSVFVVFPARNLNQSRWIDPDYKAIYHFSILKGLNPIAKLMRHLFKHSLCVTDLMKRTEDIDGKFSSTLQCLNVFIPMFYVNIPHSPTVYWSQHDFWSWFVSSYVDALYCKTLGRCIIFDRFDMDMDIFPWNQEWRTQ